MIPLLKRRWPLAGFALPLALAAGLELWQSGEFADPALAALYVICTEDGTIAGAEYMLASSGPDPLPPPPQSGPGTPLPGMPPIVDPANLYSETRAGQMSPATAGTLARVYVPEHSGDEITVIDPATLKVVDHYHTGPAPQHVVPSWDLKTLWVTNNNDITRRGSGSLTPIDPVTGKSGKNIAVDDPYNMYFMPDGSAAIIVNEAQRQLEFRDPHTLKMMYTIATPECYGINHGDFSIDGTFALFSCEFRGGAEKIDLVNRKAVGFVRLTRPPVAELPDGGGNMFAAGRQGGRIRPRDGASARYSRPSSPTPPRGMPQDVRISPDGKVFYIADMWADGVFLVDAYSMTQIGFIPTGPGAHGFCVSRDGKLLYVANRGSHLLPPGRQHTGGGVTVIDFATQKIVSQWPIPGGGSPDMGNVSADGTQLWISGRFDNEVYVFDTRTGTVTKIKVGNEPHGLTVWPQPGRFALGHTGNMR